MFNKNGTNDIIAHAALEFFPAYLQCLIFIIIGYLCGRVGVFPTSRGKSVLASYIFNIALPAGVLNNVSTDRNDSVSLREFLVSISIVKVLVYVAVIATGIIMARRARLNWGIIFLLAQCSIHSNDFGIGQPLMQALFGASNNNAVKRYPNYMQDSMAITYSVFAPLTIFFLELRRNREMQITWVKASGFAFLRALFKPITIAALVGISVRFTFHSTSPAYTIWIGGILSRLSGTITPVYLIYTGLVLVGSVQTLSNIKQAALIVAIVIIKVLMNPLLLELINYIPDPVGSKILDKELTQELSAFMFIYGALPSSPAIVIFASQFGLMTSTFAIIVILSTLIFAPVAMGALTLAYVSNCTLHESETILMIHTVSQGLNGSTLALTCWVVLISTLLGHSRRAAQLLFISQCLSLVGYCALTIGYNITTVSNTTAQAITFGKAFFECEWALLGCGYVFCICVTKYYDKSFDRVVLVYFTVATGLNLLLLCATCFPFTPNNTNRERDAVWDYKNHISNWFICSKLLLLFTSLVIGLLPSILNCVPRFRARSETRQSKPLIYNESTEDEEASENTALREFKREKMGKNPSKNACGLTPQEITKLQYVGLMTFKMTLFNFVLGAWSLIDDSKTEKMFLDLIFIKSTVLLCIGVIIFLMFGLPTSDVLKQFRKLSERWDNILAKTNPVELPPVNTLPGDVILTCQRFVQYHHTACSNAIAKDVQGAFGARLYEDVFTGEDLVSWLINVGLAEDRNEGVAYSSKLMMGRILEHTDRKKNFYDLPNYYRFITAKARGTRFGDENILNSQLETSTEFPSELQTINRDVPDWL